jgi:hypothetical protein
MRMEKNFTSGTFLVAMVLESPGSKE